MQRFGKAAVSRRLHGFAGFALALACTLAFGGPSSVFVEDLTWPEVGAAIAGGKTTAIYYAGSTEQNGPHLALGKHNFVARQVAARIARELGNALVYPITPFAPTGDAARKTGHMRFPGSVSVSDGTFAALAREVAISARAAGFRNVVLMGDHGGGQEVLARVAAELDREWRAHGARCYYAGELYYGAEREARSLLAARGIARDGHAGVADTSELLAVDRDGQWTRKDRLAGRDAAAGVEADPRPASAELGEALIAIKVRSAVAQIRSLVGRAP